MKARQKLPQLTRKKENQQGGSSCHQCKSRRNCSDLTYCTSNLDKKKKKCRKKYCEHCLRKFYRESPAQISERPTWKCPSCRKICCCAACRRRELRDKENGITTSSAAHAVPRVATEQPKIVPAQARSAAPQMGLEYPASGDESPPTTLNPFTSQTSSTSSFKALYAIAQMPSVKKHIKYILRRKDITDAQRVESIATLLRGSSTKSSSSNSSSPKLPTSLPPAATARNAQSTEIKQYDSILP
mmetsp:Transcript_18179/g.32557  ORF Transcript_18179/g.32557 Transcript_18179/m.32557 type:complete len:243 (+) Transcript_18179:408-1136(+)|eukprot:CAMPEP_0197516094 /NCGR_PEP_ID=MMETSP1318-20131121/985_1 /TAXON_ID=552666 /ORGANISM="Partenskyella glossopodia, Strain RCC365" /LENGTH=242 /DNA_ID=CAMNT_0043064611 /DNA_START=377 /DNA_END=1105 /DNA_ORIENTATION=-